MKRLQFLLRDGKSRAEAAAMKMRRRWLQQPFKLASTGIEEEAGRRRCHQLKQRNSL